ncbi:MAG: ral secretion pathway protein [Alphaproteobacteria bacterium]|nr:ral secretion pathway protein [Alphaproteobacteria bacterium]
MSLVLIFLGREAGFHAWLRFADDSIEAGPAVDGLAIGPEDRVVAIAPGDSLALHWLELSSGLAPAQAVAAARLLVGERMAQPVADLHVAVGREVEGEIGRCVALVPAATMESWLGDLAGIGVDPAAIVPEPLLLPVPEEGIVRFDRGDYSLFRAPGEAFALEPDTADLIVAGRVLFDIDPTVFEASAHAAAEDPLLDLRQGPFARRRTWRIDPALVRRLAWLAAALVVVTLAIQVATILRYTFGADALEAETRRVAAAALPRNPGVANPTLELSDRLLALRGGGVGYGAISSALFSAIRATPNVELNGLAFSPDGSLRATVAADDIASLEALDRRVEAAGFAADLGPPRSGGGRRIADLVVRPS